MKRIVLASGNKHKLEEIRATLPPGFEIVTMRDVGFTTEIDENAKTIAGNSLLKAQAIKDYCVSKGLDVWVLADDSGLEVSALRGAPGVYSARYAGVDASDSENNLKLIREMRMHANRQARFVTVLTLIQDKDTHTFEGEIKGSLSHDPRGDQGFGYDPLFIPTGYRSTFAELGPEIKNQISHRGLAVRKLLDFLRH